MRHRRVQKKDSPTMNENPLDTPWKLRNEMARLLQLPAARLSFWLNGIHWGSGWKLYGLPVIQRHRQSRISIGPRVNLRSSLRSNPLAPNHPVVLSTRRPGSIITIGEDFAMTGGTICADTHIAIGDRVQIGANSIIIDTDFHPLSIHTRITAPNVGKSSPTIIEEDVFVGANCMILKGVRLGKGCVIAAGSVVSHSIPSFALAGGVPATVIGRYAE
jgi:acetyltransferase-like isoleucine patch superfamily enzyme